MAEKALEELERRRSAAHTGSGEKRIAAQHAKDHLTARERLDILLDPGSFKELDLYFEHGFVEFSMDAQKICKIIELDMKVGAPVIGLNDSGGGRIQEGVASLGGYTQVFQRNVLASGVAQEHDGIIKHGVKLLFAYAQATVPKITIKTRKADDGVYDVMVSKHLRGDLNYAWPSAEIAVMGAKGADEIIFRQDIFDAVEIAERTADYEARFANPVVAAAKGFIDEVINPRDKLRRNALGLRKLRSKQLSNSWKKHDNVPL